MRVPAHRVVQGVLAVVSPEGQGGHRGCVIALWPLWDHNLLVSPLPLLLLLHWSHAGVSGGWGGGAQTHSVINMSMLSAVLLVVASLGYKDKVSCIVSMTVAESLALTLPVAIALSKAKESVS